MMTTDRDVPFTAYGPVFTSELVNTGLCVNLR